MRQWTKSALVQIIFELMNQALLNHTIGLVNLNILISKVAQ